MPDTNENSPIPKEKQQADEFLKAARPLMAYMATNHHPHVTAIVTATGAELLEGKLATGEILDYIRD